MTRTSATGASLNSRQSGFTITEILIVMALIALAARAVVLVLPNDQRALREEVEVFAARMKAAQDSAVFANRPVFGVVTGFGYRFEERWDDDWREIATKSVKAADWSEETRVLLASGGRTRIELSSLGAITPAQFSFTRGNAKLELSLDYDGSIRVFSDD